MLMTGLRVCRLQARIALALVLILFGMTPAMRRADAQTAAPAAQGTSAPPANLGVVRPIPIYQKSVIAVPFFDVTQGMPFEWESLPRVVRRDLELSGYFTIADTQTSNRLNRSDVELKTVQWDRWSQLGVEHYLMGSCKPGSAAGSLVVDTLLYDIASKQRVFGKQFVGTVAEYRALAHQISDEVVRYLKGADGIAQTRIAYITDRTGNRIKEVALMDYDGFGQNAPPLTRHGKLCVRPCWGANGTELYFTSYRDFNPDLYGMTLADRREWHIARHPGLNTLPAWSETLKRIVITLSKDGNSELYTMDRSGGNLTRLTRSKFIETSPCWSPDGSQIAFVSDREGGRPQIYVMNADGTNVRRITRQGSWNDAPAWSPKGDRIAFISRIEGRFDVFTCSLTGDNDSWRRLTIGTGDNETPTWAPDGRHIAFASNRTGSWQIYIMLDDGSNQQQITTVGNNQQPAWGPIGK